MKIVLEKDNNLTVSIDNELQGKEIVHAMYTLMYQLLQRFPEDNMEFAEALMTAYSASGQKNILYLDKRGDEESFSCFANGNNVQLPIATLETLTYLDVPLLEEVMNAVEQEKAKEENPANEETHNH